VDEVMALTEKSRGGYAGWNARHFHSWYRREGGKRSYTWVKLRLQEAQLISRGKRKGAHRKRRERSAVPGMMLHQDGSRHEWVAGQQWDLIVTMDDATNEHYSMFFVVEESTASSFAGSRKRYTKRVVLLVVYRSGALLAYLKRRPGGQSQSDAVWAGYETAGGQHDTGILP
jgi:hypothetical protein